jgi:cytochrome c oxidase subunit 1
LNALSTLGAVIVVLSVAVFLGNVFASYRYGALAGANPWEAAGLEWATTSPAPRYNFVHPPVVQGRHPLWDTPGALPVLTGLRTDRREVLVTTTFDALPDHRHHDPDPSVFPFILALTMGVLWIGSVFSPYFVLGGIGLALIGMFGWALQSLKLDGPEKVETRDQVIEVLA